jgi:hypothetical protein
VTPPTPLFITLLLDCDWGSGHSLDYNLSVHRACTANGWEARAALSSLWQDVPMQWPPGWEICLDSPDFTHLRGQLHRQVAGIQQVGRSLAHYLRQVRRTFAPAPRPVILLLESFSLATLAAFAVGLQQAPDRNWHVWLLYRGIVDLERSARHRHAYGWLNGLIRQRVGAANLQFLTDSVLLAESYRRIFGAPVATLPVPHTAAELPAVDAPADGRIHCWWPGAPRAEKGLAILQRLVATALPGAGHIVLHASVEAGLQDLVQPGGIAVDPLAPKLSRPAYLAQFARADVLLLPYDAAAYRARTSGIFIEAIVAGKLPLVSRETWMAHELQANGLDALAVDWSAPDLFERLPVLLADAQVRERLAEVRDAYVRLHSEAGLAAAMAELWRVHRQQGTG